MFEALSTLSAGLIFLLLISLFLVLAFEFINGFHDTANAVATVIYTQSMKPTYAVMASGLFNFIGVATGGLAVAYSIVHLLPIDLLISSDTHRMMSMIFALLAAAIIWNIGTWYLGLPASSSHTLIGSILGVGLVNAILEGQNWVTGVNWGKAIDIGLALIISPFVGFAGAALLFLLIKRLLPNANIHDTPHQRNNVEGRKHPPFWTRFFLVVSALGVSYAHGSNDGQKGVGLFMLVLIAIVPTSFVMNLNSTQYQIERTIDTAQRLEVFAEQHKGAILQAFPPSISPSKEDGSACQTAYVKEDVAALNTLLTGLTSFKETSHQNRQTMRNHLMCLENATAHFLTLESITPSEKHYLRELRKDLTKTTEYAPMWVIFSVATALGIGTMVGWKRVVKTVGEGIGKKDMTYSQGVCAQVTTSVSIALANTFGLPVSTTQVLSSGVAGTMVANNSGLRWATIRNIALAWICTFPAAMLLAGGLFFLFEGVFGK